MKTPALVGGERDRLLEVEMQIARRADELARTARWDRRDSSAPWRQAEIDVLGQRNDVEIAGSPPTRQPWDQFGEVEVTPVNPAAAETESRRKAARQSHRKGGVKISRDAKA